MMNDEDKVEPVIKEEPKHYGMELEPGVFVFKLSPMGEQPVPVVDYRNIA